jgi:hypothetical protein
MESKALTFARHINVRRKTRQATLAESWPEVTAKVAELLTELRRIEYYHNLNLSVDQAEARVELASLRGVVMQISPDPQDGSIWFTLANRTGRRRDSHYFVYFNEWRENNKPPGVSSSELADALLLEFLQEDERALTGE